MAPGNEIEEVSKGLQEASKAVTKALELAEQSGPWLGRVFGQPIEDAVGLVSDRLRFFRLRNFYRLQKYTEEELDRLGVKQYRRLEPTFTLPLIEAAALEEDESLQRTWARLLANALDPSFQSELHRGFVSILRELGPRDVHVLDVLGTAWLRLEKGDQDRGFYTFDLPARTHSEKAGSAYAITDHLPSRETQIALWNLARVGCIEPMSMFGANSTIAIVGMTQLGVAFHAACSKRNPD